MIYTVTFSPAVDYVVFLDKLKAGETNRTIREEYFFGGKGINVSTVLEELGIENTALGFISGFTGEALEKGLQEKGIKTDFIRLADGITRINVKIKTDVETEINAQGPRIETSEVNRLLEKLDALRKGDILIISGNVPNTLPGDIYERMISRIDREGIELIVDATGNLLKRVLRFRPFLVKPNREELEELVGKKISDMKQLAESAESLQKMGARNILVSLGKDGAFLLDESGKHHRMKAVTGRAVNTVGAGDSMVAGFIAGYIRTGDLKKALTLGIAAGSATACSEGLATGAEIEEFCKKVNAGG